MVKVTPADRDAAIDLDELHIIQVWNIDRVAAAFAHHREAAVEAQAAEIERLRVEAQAQFDRGYYDGSTHPIVRYDALREENERLREHLISALDTLKDADVCDDNCGPCNEAHAALE